MMLAESVFKKYSADLVITSVSNGKHMPTSRHYGGYAFDARTRDIMPTELKELTEDVSEALGNEFDVVLEVDHLHVEFDPPKK